MRNRIIPYKDYWKLEQYIKTYTPLLEAATPIHLNDWIAAMEVIRKYTPTNTERAKDRERIEKKFQKRLNNNA